MIIKKQVSRSCQINQPIANRAPTKKYEEYGTAGSSGLTHNEKAIPVVTVDDDENNELYKSEKKKKKKNKKHKKLKNKRK